MRSALLLWFLSVGAAGAAEADRAIEPLMKRPGQTVRTIVRTAVAADLNVVISLSNPSGWLQTEGPEGWWNRQSRLGVFLQRQADPAMVYQIAIEEGPQLNEGTVRVVRATPTDTVIFWNHEKGGGGKNLKFVYDLRAKALVKRVEYERFWMDRIGVSEGKVAAAGNGGKRRATVECEWERERACVVTAIAEAKLDGSPRPIIRGLEGVALPQSTYDEFARLRPERVKQGHRREHTKIEEGIGVKQKWEGTWWIAKRFYDAEGMTGVGAFGYLDRERKEFRLSTPPEVVDWSVAAMLVEADSVWLGLTCYSEWKAYAGGLLRFDRATQRVEKHAVRDVIGQIVRVGERLAMATESGIALLENGKVRRFFVDELTDGRLRVVEATH